KYTDWTHQQLNDICSQTRKHFCLLSYYSHPNLGLGELLPAVHLKEYPGGHRFSFRTKAYWLLSQLVFSATRHALLSICDRAFYAQVLASLPLAELDHALQNASHRWQLCRP